MELMVGYERVIIADAMVTKDGKTGAVHSEPFAALAPSAHANSSHDATLHAALEIGRKMGLALPSEIWAVAIEIAPTYDFSEKLTPAVAEAVPGAVDLIRIRLAELSNLN